MVKPVGVQKRQKTRGMSGLRARWGSEEGCWERWVGARQERPDEGCNRYLHGEEEVVAGLEGRHQAHEEVGHEGRGRAHRPRQSRAACGRECVGMQINWVVM